MCHSAHFVNDADVISYLQARDQGYGPSTPIRGPYDKLHGSRHPGLRQLADIFHLLFPGTVSSHSLPSCFLAFDVLTLTFPDVHCTGADRGSTRAGTFTRNLVLLRTRLALQLIEVMNGH